MPHGSKIAYLPTTLDVPVERVLDSEEVRALNSVVVLGWKGDEFFFATSTGSIPDVNITLDIAKRALIDSLCE